MSNSLKYILITLFVLCIPTIAMEGPVKRLKIEDEREYDLSLQLIKAVYDGKLEDVIKALQIGAPVNRRTNTGNSALRIAAQSGHVEIAKVLIGAGADVNLLSYADARSPLGAALFWKWPAVVAVLIKAGADMYHDFGGKSMLMKACSMATGAEDEYERAVAVSELLIEKMQSIPIADQKKQLYTFLSCLKYSADLRLRVLYYRPHIINSD